MRTGLAGALATSLWLAPSASAQLPEIPLTMNSHKLTAEVAHTGESRTVGLMNRRILPEDRGMLFVFEETGMHAMWMKNTYVPLSVAFLDERGVIINIADMEPHTLDSHGAA